MNIYLIRHGDAEKSYTAKNDFERKLTPQGIEQIKSASKGWKSFISSFDYIISSPLLRAKETAEIVAEIFNNKNDIIIDERIAAGGSTEDLIDAANELNVKDIAFVGHEPDFSNHISNLTSNSGAFVDFKKGAIAKISFNGKARLSKGMLEYLIPPKVFK